MSWTFLAREAAISTSRSPTDDALGPTTQKSRLTSSSGKECTGWLRPRPGLEFLVGQAAGQDDAFGDDRRRRQRHGDIACLGAAFLDQAAHGVGDLVELLDIAVRDPAALQRLDGTALEHQVACLVTPQFDQLDAGRTDVQTQQRRGLTTKQRPQRDQGNPLKQAETDRQT
jgi:hypothetical protein